jgi:hypothetical protein
MRVVLSIVDDIVVNRKKRWAKTAFVSARMQLRHVVCDTENDISDSCRNHFQLKIQADNLFSYYLTMTAISLAIVAKSSEPLYIKEFFDEGSKHEADLISEEELFGLPAPTENSNEDESSLSNASSGLNRIKGR